MVRRYYNLPSLIALAAFEAAARHLSLTKAAEELSQKYMDELKAKARIVKR